ncbi:MAG: ATP-binding protein [Terriglobia bacterium]
MSETVSNKVTAEELLQVPIFEGESPEAVEWIANRMEARTYQAGEVMAYEGDPVLEFVIILQGEVHFRRSAYDEILVFSAGRATGVLPFSRIKTWAGRGWAAQETKIAVMDPSHLRELVYRAPVLAQRLVSEMTDRTREFTRMEESSNRLLSLGKLAAGLAHELNNPASAAVRSSARLREVLSKRRTYAISLLGQPLPTGASKIMAEVTQRLDQCLTDSADVDPLARADLESELADWLESKGVPSELASGLVDAQVTSEMIQPLTLLVSSEVLTLALRIFVSDYEILCITRELEEASRRISDLVQSVKSYSYMDQSPVSEVDVEKGIDVTLRMFQHQLKHGIHVERQFAGNLPMIRANGSALNQIWTNLIDNAIGAMESLPPEQPKQLTLKTSVEPGAILVEVKDNGPGIPAEIRRRIFDPFFTTKPVGRGTGLGLDIVQRIIRSHKGSIRVDSIPGRTVFQVRLPITIEEKA